MRNCCGEREFAHAGHGWGRGYEPMACTERHGCGCGCGSGYGRRCDEPSEAERKQDLEAFKKHLEERLAAVTEELGKL